VIRRFARPYARAIMDIMQSPQNAQALGTELARFEQARTAARELSELYANPGVDFATKEAVTRTIAQRLKLSDMSVKVLEVLIRNHRINDLGAILEALQSYVNDALNVAVAEVRVAHELDAKERAELQQTLAQKVGRSVELRVTVDPTLLGGFVARIGSEIWDASVVGKINKFRTSLQ
jgi:F-type H+-transporting ATPase subunit delta